MAAFPEEVIFQIARQIDRPEARQLYLDQVCGAEDAVRARINALLRVHDEERSFLEHPAVSPPEPGQDATVPPGELPPTAAFTPPPVSAGAFIAGRYKLLEEIGEGGMGSVWMAEQTEPVQRRVAIKLIKPGMDSRQVVARFEAERQALALMDHPNIAKVLDGGATPDGRPFFVMELVKGTPITKFCDEKRLNVRERLELFGDVCRAVQHAHQKGIIHRDLKPSNVLVAPYDGRPVVKVIDFGVAKATGQKLTEATLFTGFGAVVGTPEYMSPEQAEVNNQDIDTRSDIYSLGVLLYELLTGSTPLTRKRVKDAALLEVLRVIREEEAPRPSTRLSSTEELPSISAQRQSEPAKLTKLVRGELDWIVMKALEKDRNRRYETANGFAMDVQRYLADEPVQACPPSAGYRFRKFARRNRGRLVAASVLALAALVATSGIGWAVRDRSARQAEAERERIERQARVTTQAELILADVDRLMEAQKWPEALSTAKRAEAALASGDADDAMREKVTDVIRDLQFVGRLVEVRMLRATIVDGKLNNVGAAREYRTSFAQKGLDPISPGLSESRFEQWANRPSLRLPVALALDDWVESMRHLAGIQDRDWLPLVGLARRIDRHPTREQLRAMWGRPITSQSQTELRKLTENIDVRSQSPATLLTLAATLKRMQLPGHVTDLLQRAQRDHPGDFFLNLELARVLDSPAESAAYCRVAVGIQPLNPAAHTNLGVALLNQSKVDEAIASHRKAIELNSDFAVAHSNLGVALTHRGNLDEAIDCYRRAIELDPKAAAPLTNLGIVHGKQGRVDESIKCHTEALQVEPSNSLIHGNLGNAFDRKGMFDEASHHYRKAIALEPERAAFHDNLGVTNLKQGKVDDAIACFERAIRLDPRFAKPHQHLGEAHRRRMKPNTAIACYKKAIELDPKYVTAHYNLGVTLHELNRMDEAIACYKKAIELEPTHFKAHYNLGLALLEQKQIREAVVWFRQAVALRPHNIEALFNLGVALRDGGGLDEAIDCFKKAVELAPEDTAIRLALGSAQQSGKRWDDAASTYLQVLKREPNNFQARFCLGLSELFRVATAVFEAAKPAISGSSEKKK